MVWRQLLVYVAISGMAASAVTNAVYAASPCRHYSGKAKVVCKRKFRAHHNGKNDDHTISKSESEALDRAQARARNALENIEHNLRMRDLDRFEHK